LQGLLFTLTSKSATFTTIAFDLRFAKPAGQTSFARKLEYPALGVV
jgi:hypothetical protein